VDNRNTKKYKKERKSFKYNYNSTNNEIREKDELPKEPMKRSELSLEGATYPLSIYIRRVIDRNIDEECPIIFSQNG
jgi:hypothetical protein